MIPYFKVTPQSLIEYCENNNIPLDTEIWVEQNTYGYPRHESTDFTQTRGYLDKIGDEDDFTIIQKALMESVYKDVNDKIVLLINY